MYDSSSYVNPTPLAHADTSRDVLPRGEAQVQDYVEVRNPKTTAQLLELLVKFEERYACKKMQGSRNSDNVG
ncbi:hypothetical protein TNCV_3089411 [Trichonephila clavipes]|nr:hypothetical protein TNCV_3089411 [Trichonephila clavipes]